MVGYIYLASAILFVVLQFSFLKVYQKSVKQCLITSLFFVFFSNAIISIFFYIYSGCGSYNITPYSFILAFILSLTIIGCGVCGILVMSKGNLSVYSLFMMLGGMLLPFIEGSIFQPYNNKVTISKIIGVVLLSLFLILQVVFDKKESGEKGQKKGNKEIIIFYILCVAIFIFNGSTSIVQAFQSDSVIAYSKMNDDKFTSLWAGLSSIIALIILIIVYFTTDRKQNREDLKTATNFKVLAFVFLQSLATGIGNFLILLANGELGNVVLYPTLASGTIVLSTLVSMVVFKEKQSKSTIIFIVLSALATILFVF